MKQKRVASIRKGKIKEAATGLLFVSPLVLYAGVFLLASMALALYYSFTDYTVAGLISGGGSFVGVENYGNLLTNADNMYPLFYQSLWVTLQYILLTVPTGVVLAVVVSALLNSKIKTERFFKTTFYIPAVTVSVAVMAMWRFLLSPTGGLLNQLLGTDINFLGQEPTALLSISVMSIWGGLGYNVLIMLSAMKNVDPTLYEAASIDGAGPFQKFFRITVPQVMPTTFFLCITGLIGAFQVFDQAYFLTGGGPEFSTYTYMFGVYNTTFKGQNQIGVGAAMSYILFVVILIFTIVQFKVIPQGTGTEKGGRRRGKSARHKNAAAGNAHKA